MKVLRKRLSIAAAGLVVLATALTPTAANAATIHGCPAGNVCIYPQGAGWNNDHPSNTYYYYGCYKLYNQYGTHRVFNNQTGYATTSGYKSSNCGTGFVYYLSYGGVWDDINLTPVNSIELTD